MDYIELKCVPLKGSHIPDLLIARLAEYGFESFTEDDEVICGYIQSSAFSADIASAVSGPEFQDLISSSSWQTIKDQNWNAVWESAYEPVRIDDRCLIRAPFHHDLEPAEFEIVIEPKMSFGTAHHETTRLMIRYLLETDVKGKSLLDMGSGTGVLAILAVKKGATPVLAVDNDEWAYQNALENVHNNHTDIEVLLGDASALNGRHFDIILANINRNILLNDIPEYRNCLAVGGTLIMSGFYDTDLPLIEQKAREWSMKLISHNVDHQWTAACFKVE